MIGFGLARRLQAFAKGKRFRVQCQACPSRDFVVQSVEDLGEVLLNHQHDGRIHVTVESLKS